MKSAFKSLVVSILITEASWLLKRHKPTIIAITGSVGKTTTKDAIYAAIKNSISARNGVNPLGSGATPGIGMTGRHDGCRHRRLDPK